MYRRNFLKYSIQSGLGLLLMNATRLTAGQERHLDKIGLQLFTVDSLLREDFEETLKWVAATGYRQIEFSTGGGLHGRDPGELKTLLTKLNLEAPNGRVRPNLLPPDLMSLPREQTMKLFQELAGPDKLLTNLEAQLPEAAVFGYQNMILSAIPPSEMNSKKALDRIVSLFNEAGQICAAHGMKFGYHNHDWDFEPADGLVPLDYLIEKTDPENVTIQLDLYWANKAKKNPADYFKRYAGRISSCHMKDMSIDGSFADVGDGTIDFPTLTGAAIDSGVKYFFVEHDKPTDPRATAENSYAYLRNMSY